ncbi:cobalamin-dependent protein [Dactylosporangium sp. AC04546]|uniref:cobalamin-dependent protein n=1 Tax=Dactylosporangium sp. AC04546 TaxID=2862460 RepID=UPI001EDF20A6|nr:cobalamin-dependent protein [Dactylosporangium sp. AC04546]WVK82337.1 cobalamin-dependent protein [Dactylosporangium sp. AC04546]
MGGRDLTLILRYRKAVTYGHHVLLAALEEHETTTTYEVVFAESAAATVEAIKAAKAAKVLVLWSFYSPDAAALAEELAGIRAAAPGAVQVAGGVHATAEPVQTLDQGWDIAAVGEGESTLLALVDSAGDPAGIQGLLSARPRAVDCVVVDQQKRSTQRGLGSVGVATLVVPAWVGRG